MSTPTAPIPLPNLASPILGAAQTPASATLPPIIPERNEFIKNLKNPLSQQQGKLAERVTKYLGSPFSTGLGAPVENIGWLGGINGILKMLFRKHAFRKTLKNERVPSATPQQR